MKTFHSPKKRFSMTLTLVTLIALFISSAAQAVTVTRGFTGLWAQPDHESQGFDIQVIDQNGGVKQMVVYWYTYDTEGNPMWLMGMGDVVDNQAEMDLITVTGPKNLQPNNPADRNLKTLATAVFSFDDCNTGTVDVTPKSISGTGGEPNSISGTGGIVNISRLTSVASTDCSGGISDDIPQGAMPEDGEMYLDNAGVYPQATAKAEFDMGYSDSDFEIELEDVPVGSYELRVGGVSRGQIQVMNSGSGSEGKIRFSSPASGNNLLLDFDPRGMMLEIVKGGTLLFSGEFRMMGGGHGNPGSSGAPEFGDNDMGRDLINTGVYPDASGEAELEQERNRVSFKVEIEDLPTGDYDLYVDGVMRGTISVTNTDSGPEGEIEFYFPAQPGKLLLDFDPRGKLIEVREGGSVIFRLNFPQMM